MKPTGLVLVVGEIGKAVIIVSRDSKVAHFFECHIRSCATFCHVSASCIFFVAILDVLRSFCVAL